MRRPSPVNGKTTITYYSGVNRLTAGVAPDLNNRLRKIVAILNMPDARSEGVILANGGRWKGFSIYVKDGHLVCESDGFSPNHQKLVSSEALPAGKVEVVFEVEKGAPPGDDVRLGSLFINGKPVGEAQFKSFGSLGWETLDIGSDTGTPVAIDRDNGPFSISDSGVLQQHGGGAQNLALVRPAAGGELVKMGENLFRPSADPEPVPTDQRHVVPGFIELSTVQPTTEMTSMIETSRLFEANVNMMKTQDQMLNQLVSHVLKP